MTSHRQSVVGQQDHQLLQMPHGSELILPVSSFAPANKFPLRQRTHIVGWIGWECYGDGGTCFYAAGGGVSRATSAQPTGGDPPNDDPPPPIAPEAGGPLPCDGLMIKGHMGGVGLPPPSLTAISHTSCFPPIPIIEKPSNFILKIKPDFLKKTD